VTWGRKTISPAEAKKKNDGGFRSERGSTCRGLTDRETADPVPPRPGHGRKGNAAMGPLEEEKRIPAGLGGKEGSAGVFQRLPSLGIEKRKTEVSRLRSAEAPVGRDEPERQIAPSLVSLTSEGVY